MKVDNNFFKIWFPKNTKQISIVPGKEPYPNLDADVTSCNYALLDYIGDKDAVYETAKLLSRRYPNADILLEPSDKKSQLQNFDCHMVVIGGPGGDEYINPNGMQETSNGNDITKLLMFSESYIIKQSVISRSIVRYTSDCEHLLLGNTHDYSADYDKNGIMTSDYGYFASIVNPWNPKYRIIIIHGIHTLGVLGAVKIFSDEVFSAENIQMLEKLGLSKSFIEFECIFKVPVFNGKIGVPRLSMENLYCFDIPLCSTGDATSREKIAYIKRHPCDLEKPFVFISYSHMDAKYILNDAVELKKRNINLWLDYDRLDGGREDNDQTWISKVTEVLKSSNCLGVIFYLSEYAIHHSDGVFQEAQAILQINQSSDSKKSYYEFLVDFKTDNVNDELRRIINSISIYSSSAPLELSRKNQTFGSLCQVTLNDNESFHIKRPLSLESFSHINDHMFYNWLETLKSKGLALIDWKEWLKEN